MHATSADVVGKGITFSIDVAQCDHSPEALELWSGQKDVKHDGHDL